MTLVSFASVSAKDFPVANPSEFEATLASVRPGDVIVLRSGVWQDAKLRFRAQGEAGRPITLRAETPGGAVFEGSSQLVIDGAHLVVSGLKFQRNAELPAVVTAYRVTVGSVVTFTRDSSECRLTETAIVDSGANVTTYVHLEPGSRSNRVDHCFFSNQGAIGVTFYVEVHPTQPNRHQIDHNYFGDRKPGTGNRWETIRIGHAEQQDFVSETTVAHNYFFRCNGENECVSDKSTGNRYLHNAFVETRGQLTLRHGARAWVEGNYFLAGEDPASEGLRVIGPDHIVINNYFKGVRNALVVYSGEAAPKAVGYRPVERALIAFNTLENCSGTFLLGASGRPVPPKDVRMIGNLVLAEKGPIIQMAAEKTDVAFTQNLLLGPDLGITARPGIQREPTALLKDQWGRVFPDPSNSPPQVETSEVAEAIHDINGNLRPRLTNVGAIAAQKGSPQYPVSRHDVGPQWMGRQATSAGAVNR